MVLVHCSQASHPPIRHLRIFLRIFLNRGSSEKRPAIRQPRVFLALLDKKFIDSQEEVCASMRIVSSVTDFECISCCWNTRSRPRPLARSSHERGPSEPVEI